MQVGDSASLLQSQSTAKRNDSPQTVPDAKKQSNTTTNLNKSMIQTPGQMLRYYSLIVGIACHLEGFLVLTGYWLADPIPESRRVSPSLPEELDYLNSFREQGFSKFV